VKTKTVSRALSIVSLLALPACAQFLGQEKLSAPEQIQMSKMNVNLYPVTKTVCDPMGGDNDPRSNAGLKADLYWLPSTAAAANSTSDLISRGTKSSKTLFFTQLNVPTRLFNTGFVADSGSAVTTDTGEMLIENFAMRFSSVLRLAPTQAEGLYELAVLSDDGTVLRLRDDDGIYKPVVDSDGNHPTRMGCSAQAINFTRDTEKLLQLDYYQGPRYHIALVVMMRKLNAGQAPGKDPSCGMSSNEAWFDYNHASAPQKAYNDLLARGWQVLTADNYAIPNSAAFNPCKEGQIPTITGVRLGETFVDSAALDWDTDIMSTSQIVVTNVKTGAQLISTADNVMSLHHHVSLGGLSADTDYTVQAVSISDTYGKGLSTPIAYHTAQ
jgi:hypothetical protein